MFSHHGNIYDSTQRRAAVSEVLEVARQAGIEVVGELPMVSTPVLPDVSKMSREELLAIIRQGGDGKSIPDPLAWQREIRMDRPLPGRD